jgi:hypothetical protein
MITVNITEKDGRLAVEVIDREASPVKVTIYDGDIDADKDVVRSAKELISRVRESE